MLQSLGLEAGEPADHATRVADTQSAPGAVLETAQSGVDVKQCPAIAYWFERLECAARDPRARKSDEDAHERDARDPAGYSVITFVRMFTSSEPS